MIHKKRLGIFARTPESGAVKTRLAPVLGEDGACLLYKALLSDLFARIARLKKVETTVFHAGDDVDALRPLLHERFQLRPQHGLDLGARMANALGTLLEGGGRAVIIGSDSPDIPLNYIKRAFLKLKHRQLILGPAFDGGYYLVGAAGTVPPVFEGVAWGTGRVFAESLDRAFAGGIRCGFMPLWYDVDTLDSLSLLIQMVRARRLERGDRLVHTESALHALGQLPASGPGAR